MSGARKDMFAMSNGSLKRDWRELTARGQALGAIPASLWVARLVCRSSLRRDRRELTARVQTWRDCNSTAVV